ncbi:aspartate/glutamate racemase family protein [Gordonia sp. KTR9]|uniref:aspartate/glutamate racemase family protein n=1 Tax=Gordonia sp. KTR9 TaxID=337191 RepID=UPI00031506E0|nr:aspartate/glutamate racemase family protein [Gordonia sp. KTR9]
MVAAAQRAQAEGFDGVVIACSGDPCLQVVREAVDIPVSAPTEAAIRMSRAFGKLAILARQLPDSYASRLRSLGSGDFWQTTARENGLNEGEYAFRRVPITNHPEPDVLDHLTSADPDRLRELTLDAMTQALRTDGLRQAAAAVAEDGVDAVYFACTFFSKGIAELNTDGAYFGVPVLNPLVSAANFVESAIISQSAGAVTSSFV